MMNTIHNARDESRYMSQYPTQTEDTSGLKSSPSSQGVRFVPMSPVSNSRAMLKGSSMPSQSSSSSMKNQAMNDPNSLGRSSMRPFYPPNYVSKAHLIRQMDRKEFIKMLMTEQEREQFKIDDDNFDVREPESITQQKESDYSGEDKMKIEQFKIKAEYAKATKKEEDKNKEDKKPAAAQTWTENKKIEEKNINDSKQSEKDTKLGVALPTVSMVMKYDEPVKTTTSSSMEVGEAPTTTTEMPAITTINSIVQL